MILSGSIYVLKDSGGQERQERVILALGGFFFLSFMLN